MAPSGCKQVTASDVISGWHCSGPLADQIRRKKHFAASKATWAQKTNWRFGIEGEEWTRLRWGQRWARPEIRGWSGRAVAKWFSVRKMQDQNPKSLLNANGPDWYTAHQP